MVAVGAGAKRSVSIRPNLFEKMLAGGSIAILGAVAAALIRGHAQWNALPALIWLHLATILVSLTLTPILLLSRRGVRHHRVLGYIWVASMLATAALSFGIRTINPGGLSPIHILSAITLIQAPMIAWRAHRHNVSAHRLSVQIIVLGALLIAGFFTFPFGRLLGRWLLGSV